MRVVLSRCGSLADVEPELARVGVPLVPIGAWR
jgi:hypothetical protein